MKHLAEHNVVATFPDMDKARHAVDALARAGIEAEDISLLGRPVEEARNDADTRLRDMEDTGHIAKRAGADAVAGSDLGAVAGLAAFAVPGVGPVVGMGLLAAAAGGSVAGASVGGMVGGVAGISLEDDWGPHVLGDDPGRQGPGSRPRRRSGRPREGGEGARGR